MMEELNIVNGNTQPRRSFGKYYLIGGGILLAILLIYGAHGCMEAVSSAGDQANLLIEDLHMEMEQQDWDQIYFAASDGYKKGTSQQKSQLYFSSISRKLGSPNTTSRQSVFISGTTSGTYIRATYKTQFSDGDIAFETIVWKQEDGQYRLFQYDLQSDTLITK
jgi:hypothetical protein